MTLERITRPPSITEAAVSSQELSIPRTSMRVDDTRPMLMTHKGDDRGCDWKWDLTFLSSLWALSSSAIPEFALGEEGYVYRAYRKHVPALRQKGPCLESLP